MSREYNANGVFYFFSCTYYNRDIYRVYVPALHYIFCIAVKMNVSPLECKPLFMAASFNQLLKLVRNDFYGDYGDYEDD